MRDVYHGSTNHKRRTLQELYPRIPLPQPEPRVIAPERFVDKT